MTDENKLTRWAILVYSGKFWHYVVKGNKLSLHHLPKTFLNKEEANKVAAKFEGANLIEWKGAWYSYNRNGTRLYCVDIARRTS